MKKCNTITRSYNALGCQSSSLECARIQEHITQNSDPWPDVDYAAAEGVLARHAQLLPAQPLQQQMQQLYINGLLKALHRFSPDVNTRDGVPIVCAPRNMHWHSTKFPARDASSGTLQCTAWAIPSSRLHSTHSASPLPSPSLCRRPPPAPSPRSFPPARSPANTGFAGRA
jgi:hypothetical protein